MEIPFSENYRIKMVEQLRKSTRQERETWIREAKYNLFNLHSEQVFIDLLTDSGTGAMSDKQWSAMMLGDESYAGATSYYKMRKAIQEILGFEYFLPTHQGRAAENVLYSTIVKAGDVVPGNSHFDTTKRHIEFRKAAAVDCTIDAAADTQLEIPFKGEMDLEKLEKVLKETPKDRIPCCVLTVTNNTAGGQPVSMKNIRETSELCHKYGILVQIDGARFAENAYFIKTREEGYQDKSIKEIVREMLSYGDIMTMSSKKDAIVNMGGFLAFRDKELWRRCQMFCVMNEGFITYGGLSVPKEEFIAQTLGIELYLEAGIRGVEIGSILADRDPITRENRYPRLELLRLAIPRRTYTNNHMDVIAAAVKNVFDRRESITRGYVITEELPVMRHFTIELAPAK